MSDHLSWFAKLLRMKWLLLLTRLLFSCHTWHPSPINFCLFKVVFTFYHSKAPLNHRLGNVFIFVPTALVKSEWNTSFCINFLWMVPWSASPHFPTFPIFWVVATKNQWSVCNFGALGRRVYNWSTFISTSTPPKLTWQWKMGHLKMYLFTVSKIVIFRSHGSFRGGYIFPLKRIGHHVHTYMPHVSPPYETVVPFFRSSLRKRAGGW